MYQRGITHLNRSAVIIAIDCSLSMQDWCYLHNTRMRKMDAASLIANFALDELVVRATRGNDIRNYYDIAVIGYSGDGVEVLHGDENSQLANIKSLFESLPQPTCYNIVQQDSNGNKVSVPLTLHEWVEPKACGTSPMYEAMVQIKSMLTDWCDNPHNRDSFPPLVINISDGGCNDADYNDIVDIAKDIKELHTFDGSTLFVNIYLATDEGQNNCSIVFPEEEETIADEQERLLYEMSSTLPEELEHVIYELSRHKCHRARKCFARNASICEVLAFANIGTEGCMGIKHR